MCLQYYILYCNIFYHIIILLAANPQHHPFNATSVFPYQWKCKYEYRQIYQTQSVLTNTKYTIRRNIGTLLRIDFQLVFQISFLTIRRSSNMWPIWKHLWWTCHQIPSWTFTFLEALFVFMMHTSYLSQTPQTCLCKKKLPGVNFYRFNAKNWRFLQI